MQLEYAGSAIALVLAALAALFLYGYLQSQGWTGTKGL
jgi:hypothetical protein